MEKGELVQSSELISDKVQKLKLAEMAKKEHKEYLD